jgi:hypothetical protein
MRQYVQVVVRAADWACLAALNATDNVHDRIALNTNHSAFDWGDDSDQAGHLKEVLVIAVVSLVAAVLLLNYSETAVSIPSTREERMKRTIAAVDFRGCRGSQGSGHEGRNSEVGNNSADGEHVER